MHHHSHRHPHPDYSHSGADSANERKVLLSFVLIASFMVVEAIGGIISGSLALLADAGHMLTDAAALGLTYAAFRIGRRPADSRRTFGYLRLEVIAGFLNAITLFAIAGWVLFEAWQRFRVPPVVLVGPMLTVAVLGLVVNAVVLRIMTHGDTENINVRGAILHVMGDLLGSVGAITAALVIYFTGWTPIDPLLSVLVALLILRSAGKLLVKSLHILLEGAPEGISPEKLRRELLSTVPGLTSVHHIHVWQLTSGQVLATLHVRPQSDDMARTVVQEVERVLAETFGITHATVAIDWNPEAESVLAAKE